jgi:TonB family protein
MSRYLVTYFKKKQDRGEKVKHRKLAAAGLSPTAPLKTIVFSQEQKGAFAKVEPPPSYLARREAEKSTLTPKRISALFALSLHLIAVLIGSYYIVQNKNIDDDAIVVEIMEAHQVPQKRQMPRRVIQRIERPQSMRIQVPQVERPIATALKIPAGHTRFSLPQSDVPVTQLPTASTGDGQLRAPEIRRAPGVDGKQVKIASVIPAVNPQRIFNSSIIKPVETKAVVQALPEPKAALPPTVSLSDVTEKPRFLKPVKPKYPSLARHTEKEGVVLLEASIGIDGLARDIQVIEGLGYGFDEAAVEALKASRFAPAMQGEKKVVVRITIPYRFSLEQS